MSSSLLVAERRSSSGRFATALSLLALGAILLPAALSAAARLSDSAGDVFSRKTSADPWAPLAKGAELAPGLLVRTGAGARATILFDDGSRIELGANSNLSVAEASEQATAVVFSLGSLKAWISKSLNRQFRVRTPTAVCSVRGTDWSQTVAANGNTSFTMGEGLLSVSDNFKNEVLLKKGDRLDVTDKGLGQVAQAAVQLRPQRRELAKREVGLEMTKEEVQAAAAAELRSAVLKEGKAIIDVNGSRVRIEEYIIRPQPNQFKLVVLDSRVNNFNYFFYQGTFNQPLPSDLSVALRQLPGCIGAPCQFFMTGYTTARSNTADNMLEVATGGHLVDVNNNAAGYDANGNPNTAVTAAFDPISDKFLPVQVGNANVNNPAVNTPFFKAMFNTDTLSFNGVVHQSWVPSGTAPNLANNLGCAGGPCVQNNTTDLNYTYVTSIQKPPACGGSTTCTYNDPGVLHQVIYDASPDGSIWDRFDSYIISDVGKVATVADFAGITSGAQYKSTLLNWNFQTIVTAAEFNGRKIDLAVEPKIFIESGLIP